MRNVIIFLFCTISLNIYADDAIHLDSISISEVKVITRRVFFPTSGIRLDSSRIANAQAINLSKFLQENSSLQFKTYGSSGSSVMSIRGANAAHSKINWNGMDIGSPMLNMNDVSLLGSISFDDVILVRGGSSAKEGNSALSGILKLYTKPKFNTKSIKVSADFNSISNRNYSLSLNFGKKQFASQTSLQVLNNLNNFSFNNYAEFGNPLQNQVNSEFNQFAIIQSLFYKYKKHSFSSHFWYQESDRNLSPAIYNRTKKSYQLDKSFRAILKDDVHINEHHNISTNISFTRENLRYVSRVVVNNTPLVLFNTNSYFDQLQVKSNYTFQKNRIKQELGFTNVFDGAYVEDYGAYKKRNRFSLQSNTSYFSKYNIDAEYSNRLEYFKQSFIYASNLNFSYSKFSNKGIIGFLKFSKNYNIPGLNDLYWIPGGNPNLNAEKSLEVETGFSYEKKWKNIFTSLESKLYRSMVSDWILWQPSAIENGLWSPQNLAKVKLQGLEIDWKIDYQITKKQMLSLQIFYAATQAINMKSKVLADQSLGKQLIYIPLNKSGINLQYSYNNSSVSINQHYVSHRFTTADQTEFLPSYSIIDLRLQNKFIYKNNLLIASIYIENIQNNYYESIPFQAMPARVFGINLKYELTNY